MITVGDIPVPHVVVARTVESPDVVTLRVRPCRGEPAEFLPAQFSMIGLPGIGEVPISISSGVADRTAHGYTLRAAGAVTAALVERRPGAVVLVRGPFGRAWDLEPVLANGALPLFVAGGIGLAPLRAAIEAVMADRGRRGWVAPVVLVGARTPEHLICRTWLEAIATEAAHVWFTVDEAAAGEPWPGHVGLVTELIPRALRAHRTDPSRPVAVYVCGPDPMMVAAVAACAEAGVPTCDVQLTLERNMRCATGTCGHCQLGPLLVCRDGPVVRADVATPLLTVPAL